MMLRSGERITFESEWREARPTVTALLKQESVCKREWQKLFETVYRICSWIENGGSLVLRELDQEVHSYILTAAVRIRRHEEPNAVLRAYISEWTKFYAQTQYFPMPFVYTVGNGRESLSKPSKAKKEIETRDKIVAKNMLTDWNETIFKQIRHKLQAAALHLLKSERNGESFDPSLVIGVRESYVALNLDMDDSLSVYKEIFEKSYIESTEEYYKTRAEQILTTEGVQNYMDYADAKLREEEARGARYLESGADSLQKLLDSCVGVLVVKFQDQLLAEFPNLLNNNLIEKMRTLYRLLNATSDGISAVLVHLEHFISTQASNDMMANANTITSDPEKYVEQLLALFKKFSDLVSTAFYNDPRFLTTRDKAFQNIVNDTCIFKIQLASSKYKNGARLQAESKCPELLACFTDLILRKTSLSKRLTSEEIDEKLNDVLLVLKYVENKDVFMRYYKAHLTRRLILEFSADQEKEEQMITRMRDVGMPTDFITQMYRMLQDVELNKDFNSALRNSVSSCNCCNLSDLITVKILHAGAWSRGIADRVKVQMPRELEEYIPEVEDFYRKQHSGRKLQWHHHWSHGTVQFTNAVGRFDLDVTTLQMAVLFCWNDRPFEKLSYESLRVATQLPSVELSRALHSLAAFPKMKQQVLCTDCTSHSPRDFTDSTQFWINQDFSVVKNGKKMNRGRINLIGRLQLVMEPNVEAEHEDIVALRVLRIQEGIVKIMKSRKECQNAQLQTELIEMLKNMFYPSTKLVKEQIEWLIEHEYIKRDPSDNSNFIYII